MTINLTLGENGIFRTAEQAGRNYTQAQEQELAGLAEFENEINNIIGGIESDNPVIPPEPEHPPIDKAETKVGYYADVNGDGTPDGVIYADLAFAKSGQWSDGDGTYSYTKKENTKDYYISQTNYAGSFGTKDVLTAIEGSEGEDRFYVMALEDFGTGYSWYADAYDQGMSDYATATSVDFGTGRANTVTMIGKWNSNAYGAQNQSNVPDMWGAIQTEIYEDGDQKGEPTWFVPSIGELGAFGDNLGITADNYANYGLSNWCWSSSQCDAGDAWYARFYDAYMNNLSVNVSSYVRLSATF